MEMMAAGYLVNANNTPRAARIDYEHIPYSCLLELPNSAGNHSSPFITENTEYVVAGTRFSIPLVEIQMFL